MIYRKTFVKEVSLTAAGVFLLLLAVLVAVQAVKLLGGAAGGRVAVDAVLTLLAFWTVSLLPVVLILTAYIGSLTVLSRYWRDSEMSVWLSSGLSLYAWIKPLSAFALPFVVLTAAVSLWLMPWTESKSREFAEVLKQKQEAALIRPGVFQELGGSRPRVYFVEHFDAGSGEARGLFIRERQADGRDTLITAEYGRFTENKQRRTLELSGGRRYSGTPGQADYNVVAFDRMSLLVGTAPKSVRQNTHRRTLPTSVLWNSSDPRHRSELMWRLTMPISIPVLVLLTLPLSYSNRRSRRNYSLIFAITAFAVYQNGLNMVRSGIDKDLIPFWFGLTVPHLLMLAAAGCLLYRYSRPVWIWRLFGRKTEEGSGA